MNDSAQVQYFRRQALKIGLGITVSFPTVEGFEIISRKCRTPRSIHTVTFFTVTRIHIWRNGNSFHPKTSISRPRGRLHFAEVPLFSAQSHGHQSNAVILLCPLLGLSLEQSCMTAVMAPKRGGSFMRDYPRHSFYSIVKAGDYFVPSLV